MEIIKRQDVSKVLTCDYCKSVLKYEPQDIQTLFPTQAAIEAYGSDAMPMDYIKCPVCNCKNYI